MAEWCLGGYANPGCWEPDCKYFQLLAGLRAREKAIAEEPVWRALFAELGIDAACRPWYAVDRSIPSHYLFTGDQRTEAESVS